MKKALSLIICLILVFSLAVPAFAAGRSTVTYTITKSTMTISGKGSLEQLEENGTYPWFTYADEIDTIVIKRGITEIPDLAFYGASIRSITIPGTVKTVGAYSFYDSDVSVVYLGEGIKTIGTEAFSGSSVENIVIPKSVTSIPYGAFYGCPYLSTVKIQHGTKRIEASAFYGCSALEHITIPDSITEIQDGAFSFCDSLRSVQINRKTYVCDGAFPGYVQITRRNT